MNTLDTSKEKVATGTNQHAECRCSLPPSLPNLKTDEKMVGEQGLQFEDYNAWILIRFHKQSRA